MLNRTSMNLIELVATRCISWRNPMVWTKLSLLYRFFLEFHLIRFDGLLSCWSSKSLHADMVMNGFHHFPLLFQITPYFVIYFFSFSPPFCDQLSHMCLFLWYFPQLHHWSAKHHLLCGQQLKGADSAPLLCSCETPHATSISRASNIRRKWICWSIAGGEGPAGGLCRGIHLESYLPS